MHYPIFLKSPPPCIFFRLRLKQLDLFSTTKLLFYTYPTYPTLNLVKRLFMVIRIYLANQLFLLSNFFIHIYLCLKTSYLNFFLSSVWQCCPHGSIWFIIHIYFRLRFGLANAIYAFVL